jgi:hypothetical protein
MAKHSAVLPNGTVIKRNSANRTYTHVVAVGPTPKIDRIRRAEQEVANATADVAGVQEIITYLENNGALVFNPGLSSFMPMWRLTSLKKGGSINDSTYGFGLFSAVEEDVTDETQARIQAVAHYQARLVSAQAALQNKIAELEATKMQPEFLNNNWVYAGWCGRLDLAQKLAAQSYGNREVRILEAEVAA